MFQSLLNKPGSPPRVEQTSPELSAGEISLPRVDTPESPSVKKRVNEPSPKEGKHKTPAPTITSTSTTRYKYLEKQSNMTPQKEIYILEHLTLTELTHLFDGLGFTEGQ